jgi:hypothetical protein
MCKGIDKEQRRRKLSSSGTVGFTARAIHNAWVYSKESARTNSDQYKPEEAVPISFRSIVSEISHNFS